MSIYVNSNGQQSSIPTLGILQQDKMQFTTLPIPSIENKDKVFQYIGETKDIEGTLFKQGFFYVCKNLADGYKWVQLDLNEMFLNNARDIHFDNDQTDIDANNVYNALVELSISYFNLLLEIA